MEELKRIEEQLEDIYKATALLEEARREIINRLNLNKVKSDEAAEN